MHTFTIEDYEKNLMMALALDSGVKAVDTAFQHYLAAYIDAHKGGSEQHKAVQGSAEAMCELYPVIRESEHSQDGKGNLKAAAGTLLERIFNTVLDRWAHAERDDEKALYEPFLAKYCGKNPHNGKLREGFEKLRSGPSVSSYMLDLFKRWTLPGTSFTRAFPKEISSTAMSETARAITDRLGDDARIEGLHILLPWLRLTLNPNISYRTIEAKRAIFLNMCLLMKDAGDQAEELIQYCEALNGRYEGKYEFAIPHLDKLVVWVSDVGDTCPDHLRELVTEWSKTSTEFKEFVIRVITKKEGRLDVLHDEVKISS